MNNIENFLDQITVLFVDDEDGVRESYDMLLNMWCKKAYSAKNGKEGLELFKEYKPDIVVTDIKMPVMNGLDMIKHIKDIYPDTPTIITTAHQEPELLLDAVELQVDAYIVKPIPKKELKKRLEMIAKILLFEKERKMQYDILQNIINSTIEAVLVFENKRCINVNSTAVELFGFNDVDQMLNEDLYLKIFENKDPSNSDTLESMIKNSDGIEIPILSKYNNVSIGSIQLSIFTCVDLRDLKKLENESKIKDKIMFHQSKMAAMGEMLGNIAHQWRQPLSIISTSASGIKLEKEYGLLSDEKQIEYLDIILNQTRMLSQTIDDFRDFFNPNKNMHEFNLEDVVTKTISFLEGSLKTKEINIIVDIDKIKTIGLDSELTHSLINIINNSKDAHMLTNNDNKYIFIDVHKNKGKIDISIKDNAGGIDKNIINRIFEPYFTTKHQSQGTGIGLYMTQEMIVNHMNGTISVHNVEFTYNDINCKGVEFMITLPLKTSFN